MARAETTVIGRGSRIRGRISGTTDLEILGYVEGEIEIAGDLVIDVHGLVAAGVSAHRLTVRGAVKGDLSATEAVVLESGAKVVGDIRAPKIVIAPGALLRGYVQTGNAGASAPRAKAQTATVARSSGASAPSNTARTTTVSASSSGSATRAAQAPQVVHVPSAAHAASNHGANNTHAATRASSAAGSPAKPTAKGPPAPTVPVLKKGAKGTLQKKRA